MMNKKKIDEFNAEKKEIARYEWLDFLKGIAALLVVLGHSIVTPVRNSNVVLMTLSDCIYYFHMPLWMILSGYCAGISLKKNRYQLSSKWIKKKTIQLVLPYFAYALFVYAVFVGAAAFPIGLQLMQRGNISIIPFENYILQMFTGMNTYCGHLWYLYVLFLFYLLLYVMNKLFEEKCCYAFFLISIAVMLLRGGIRTNTVNVFITHIPQLMVCFATGLFLELEKVDLRKIAVTSVLIIGWLYVKSLGFMTETTILGKEIVYIGERMSRICISILFLLIAEAYFRNFKNGFMSRKVSYLGKKCMDIYIWQTPFFTTIVGTLLSKLITNGYIVTILTVVSGLIFPILISMVFGKFKHILHSIQQS